MNHRPLPEAVFYPSVRTARDTAQRIIGPAGGATFCIGLGQFVAELIIAVAGHVTECIGDCGKSAETVIAVIGGDTELKPRHQ